MMAKLALARQAVAPLILLSSRCVVSCNRSRETAMQGVIVGGTAGWLKCGSLQGGGSLHLNMRSFSE